MVIADGRVSRYTVEPKDVALAVTHAGKSFGGARALADVSVSLIRGEVHAIAGENGSGKSTLLGSVAGAVTPDCGELTFEGVSRPWWRSIADARKRGIMLVSQELNLVPEMSVAANVALASDRPKGRWAISARRTETAVRDLLERVGLGDVDPRARVVTLPLHVQQLIEIARALSAQPRVLLLDEPTSSLERHEAAAILDLARDLAHEDGLAVALITHRMKELVEYADRVSILRDGVSVRHDLPGGCFTADTITQDMVGRDIDFSTRAGQAPQGRIVLEVRDLADAGERCRGIDLDVHAGEIVGLAGLVGAGRTELLETIFGLRRRSRGTVRVSGRSVRNDVRSAMRSSIRLVPDDRLAKALVPGMSVSDNLDLDWRRHAVLRRQRDQRRRDDELMARHRIVAGSGDVPVRSLSGGNQQKAVFARQLKVAPEVLLLDEPTRGVDVGAKSELYDLLRHAANEGACVVIASSELEELIQLCHRIFVMFEGRLVAEFGADRIDDDEAMAAAATGLVDMSGAAS